MRRPIPKMENAAMFADPQSITYNAVSKDLVKVNQDNWGSDFYLDEGTSKFSLSIRHTVPPRGGSGESHMLRLDVDTHDLEGKFIRRTSAWTVIKTFDGVQEPSEANHAANALAGLLSSGNVGKMVGREN